MNHEEMFLTAVVIGLSVGVVSHCVSYYSSRRE